MKKILIGFAAIALVLSVAACPFVFAGSAMDDLADMDNTGVTFDGSDGQRSGMDIDFIDVEGPAIPEPTPERVDTDN